LAEILTIQFATTPQRVAKRFRRMRSLAFGGGAGESAIVFPFGLSSETPAGDLASVQGLLLEGRDVALAVSSEFIVSKIAPMLDSINGLQRDYLITNDAGVWGGLSIDYHARVDATVPEWVDPSALAFIAPAAGIVRIRLTLSGWATRLYRSGIFNVDPVSLDDLALTATVDQVLVVTFDALAERLLISALGEPVVTVNYTGPFADDVVPIARETIRSAAKAHLTGPLSQAQNELDSLATPTAKRELSEQLRRIDPAAAVRFDNARLSCRRPHSARHRVRRLSPETSSEVRKATSGGRIRGD
jgi:hypothetical protein